MLPALSFRGPVEPYAISVEPTCDRTDKPGVVAFKHFVMATLGGGDLGMDRPCDSPRPSDHWSRRAWDWALDASNPADVARAAALTDWLLASDAAGTPHAMLRRAGITYLIWNHQIWSTKMGMQWQAYTGPNPHVDHMHISFGWPGALAQTSLYGALGVAPAPTSPSAPAPAAEPAEPPPPRLGDVVSLFVGAVAGWYGTRWWQRRARR